jgi:ubiquinone biosynthesis protein COQ9
MAANVQQLLKRCFPLIPQHGFTRKTIALASIYDKCNSGGVAKHDAAETAQDGGMTSYAEGAPLSETAISALFGSADGARRTLINAWLATATEEMGTPWKLAPREASRTPPPLIDLLQRRLELNKPVLNHLSEVRISPHTHMLEFNT